MAWELGGYWIDGDQGVDYSFGPYTSLPLLYFVARPEIFPTKLRIEPTSVELVPGGTEGTPPGNGPWFVHTVVTNQSNGSTWFSFVGTTLT